MTQPIFRMNEYQTPIDIRRDITVYNLEYMNIVENTLSFYFTCGMRVFAEAYSEGERIRVQQLEGDRFKVEHANVDHFAGVLYVFWRDAIIPDHEIVCSYEYIRGEDRARNRYIQKQKVNWMEEGF